MPLLLSCPRCARDIAVEGDKVRCDRHGLVAPLERPTTVDDQALREVSGRVPERSIYVPWPLSPAWSIADFGCVADADSATFTTTVGSTRLDGRVEITVVSEDPGVGLGARSAELAGVDPGVGLGRERPDVRVRIGGRAVPLWPVERLDSDVEVLSSAAFAGEADGRWLWIVVRPAGAALLLRDDWLLSDIGGVGPDALEMSFGGERPTW